MTWLRKIFCRHRKVKFARNIYGDEIFHSGGKRSLWECCACGNLITHEQLFK